MNALVLLMSLLALGYLSSLLRAGRAGRAIGLPAGSEWMLLGFVLGGGMLGVVDRALQNEVEPVVFVAIGWVSLIVGVDYGVVHGRRLGARRLALGLTIGALTMGAVGGAAFWLAPRIGLAVEGTDRWALALGLSAVGGETACDAVNWVSSRRGSVGKLSVLLDDLAETKAAACILASGTAICLHSGNELARRLPLPHLLQGLRPPLPPSGPQGALTLLAIVLAVGALLGLMATMMLSREARTEQTWGLLVGIVLLAAGTTALLKLPVVSALFAIGVVIGFVSCHRERISAMVDPTRRGAILPVLLLAGARLEPHLFVERGLLIGGVLAARMLVLFVAGWMLAPLARAPSASSLLGPAMLPTGQLSATIGLSFALTFPGMVGETVLAVAAVLTVVGELVGPLALRAALRRAGEIGPESPPLIRHGIAR